MRSHRGRFSSMDSILYVFRTIGVCVCTYARMVNDGDDDERGLTLLAGFLRADSVAFALASRYCFIMGGECVVREIR